MRENTTARISIKKPSLGIHSPRGSVSKSYMEQKITHGPSEAVFGPEMTKLLFFSPSWSDKREIKSRILGTRGEETIGRRLVPILCSLQCKNEPLRPTLQSKLKQLN